MITTPVDYLSLLYKIQQEKDYQLGQGNYPSGLIVLPTEEKIFNINLNTRVVEAPEFLSVYQDHNAETLYFKADRFFDGVDLAHDRINIVIQYQVTDPKSHKKTGYLYMVPFIDVEYFEQKGEKDKILFPWVIEGPATMYPGVVTFSVKFYRLDAVGNYEYNLNTLTSQSKVLHGMDITDVSVDYEFQADIVQQFDDRISAIEIEKDFYWTLAEDVQVYARKNLVYQSIPITKYFIDGDEISMSENYKMYLKGAEKTLSIEIDTYKILSDNYSYQWYKDGYKLNNANNSSLRVRTPGYYYIIITNESNGLIAQTIGKTFDVRQ